MTSRESEAARTVELAKRLEHWARSTRAVGAGDLVLDATDLYRAALAYVDAVDRLLAHPHAPARQQAKTLVEIQTWLYDELEDHLRALKRPLRKTIDQLYELTSEAPK